MSTTTLLPQFKSGDRMLIRGEHLWCGQVCTLIRFGRYGPEFLGLRGWLVAVTGVDGPIQGYVEEQKLVPPTA